MDEVSVGQEESMILLVYTHLFLFYNIWRWWKIVFSS